MSPVTPLASTWQLHIIGLSIVGSYSITVWPVRSAHIMCISTSITIPESILVINVYFLALVSQFL